MIFATLSELADRVETLVPPANDDDMTWMTWCQVATAIWRYVGRPDHPHWHHEPVRNVWWWGEGGGEFRGDRPAPEYLLSWDAAYGLVDPGWRLALAGGDDRWSAVLTSIERTVGASAATAPQAIVAAAIRSRIKSDDRPPANGIASPPRPGLADGGFRRD